MMMMMMMISAARKGKYYNLVKWIGFDDPTWEPAENILDDNLIRKYWSSKSIIRKSK
jgi:hypothetical protein